MTALVARRGRIAALIAGVGLAVTAVAPAQAWPWSFTTNTSISISGASTAVSTANGLIGKGSTTCSDGTCRSLSEHLAGRIWGYKTSGFTSAAAHMSYLKSVGKFSTSYNIPVGALVFFPAGTYGFVGVYVGSGYVVLPAPDAYGVWNIRKVTMNSVADRFGGYSGWGYPLFPYGTK